MLYVPIIHPPVVIQTRPLPNHMGTFRRCRDHLAHYQVIILNPGHYQADFWIQPKGHKTSVTQVTQQQKAIIGINGSYYSPTFKPVGLFKLNGKRYNRYSKSRLLSALVMLNSQQQLLLDTRHANYQQNPSALQTGPILIQHHRIALNPTQRRFRRTLLAISDTDKRLIITTTPVTLYHLAWQLKHYPKAFGVKGIKMAVNLDGGVSTALTIRFQHNPVIIAEHKPVKTMILFKKAPTHEH